MKTFDDLALAYDNSIDWESRLSRELPFIRSFMKDSKNTRVLDIACGSGRHSVALANLGFNVVGFDTSEGMIAAARNHAKSVEAEVDFIIADMFTFQKDVEGPFDIVLCLGNSLALLSSFKEMQEVVAQVHGVLDPHGSFIFQVLNFDEILLSGFRFFPIKGGETSDGNEVVFSRFYEHSDDAWSTLVATSFVKKGKEWETSITTQRVLHTNQAVMTDILEAAGFGNIKVFSDYSRSDFVSDVSRNLVVSASCNHGNE
jgi:2-polyprenyl-3-methyl-5-hydroxy-6-metoxy-1,4-benzoquinol methylase